MKKNVSGQVIGAQMIDASDGSAFTGTVSVSVTIDGGTFTAGAGTAPAHEGGGYHSYTPTQAETNGTQIAFTFSGTGALSSTIQIYTNFPQTQDHASALVTIDGNVDSLVVSVDDLPTVSEFNARTLLSTDYFNPSVDVVANVTDVVTTTNLTNLPSIPANWLTAAGIATGALNGKGDWNVGKTGYSISGTLNTLDDLENVAITDIVTGGVINVVSGLVAADTVAISGDTVAADNLEAMYDGTGYTDDSAPSSRSQVNNIGAATGGAINFTPVEDNTGGTVDPLATVFVGSVVSGTFEDVGPGSAAFHSINDVGDDIDIVYGYQVGGSRQASTLVVFADVDGGNDFMDISIYDHVGADWEEVAVIEDDDAFNIPFVQKHTGTGAELGKVYVRFSTSATSPSNLTVFECITSAVNVNQSVGYANGEVWIDTIDGTSGVESYVNGTADNPSDTYSNVITIAGNIGLHRYQAVNGSSIQLTNNTANDVWTGTRWALDLNGQDVGGAFFQGACISGTAIGSTPPHFEHCEIEAVTLPPCRINGGSGFLGTLTLGAAGQYDIIDCNSLVSTATIIDLLVGGGPNILNIRGWEGGLTFDNMETGDVISVEGVGGVLTIDGTGGVVCIRGIFEEIIDLSGGAVEISETAMLNRQSLVGYELGAVYLDTLITNTGELAYVDGTADNPVSTIAAAVAVAAKIGNGLNTYYLNKGSSIALNQAFTATVFTGIGGTIDLGGQDISFATFSGQNISGVGIGSGRTFWEKCRINGSSLNSAAMLECSLNGTINLTAATDYSFNNCYGTSTSLPLTINLGAIADQAVDFNNWDGVMIISNMGQSGTDNVLMNGQGTVTLSANCIGGTLTVAGDMTVIDNSGGAVTIVRSDISGSIVDILEDTNELQADWANTGRLDTILDSRMAEASIDTTAGSIDNVTLVDTTTTNTDMVAEPDNTGITDNGNAIAALNDISVVDILTTQMTEAYAADGTAPTLTQALMLIQQVLSDFSITGDTNTIKKLDGSTTAATLTLTPNGTSPTGTTRAS